MRESLSAFQVYVLRTGSDEDSKYGGYPAAPEQLCYKGEPPM